MFSALGSIKSSIAGFLPETVDPAAGQKSFYELKAPLPGNKEYDFADLKGKVVLIVNTASKCGFTYQFTGLEELNKEYGDRGLKVLGFPSNEFAGQDPGTDADIESFCQVNHGVTFKLMKKSEVNGSSMNEVFAWLKTQKSADGTESFAGPIKWNFNKFLVNREGQVVGRYGSSTKPEAMKADIEKLL